MMLTFILSVLAQSEPVRCYYWPPNATHGGEVSVWIHEDGRTPKAWALGALRTIVEGPQDEHTLRLFHALQIMASMKLAKVKGE